MKVAAFKLIIGGGKLFAIRVPGQKPWIPVIDNEAFLTHIITTSSQRVAMLIQRIITVLKHKVLIEVTLAPCMVIDLLQLLSASSKFFVY